MIHVATVLTGLLMAQASIAADVSSVSLLESEFKVLQKSGVVDTAYPSLSIVNDHKVVEKISPDSRQDWQTQLRDALQHAHACKQQSSKSGSDVRSLPADLQAKLYDAPAVSPPCVVLLTFMPGFCNFCVEVRTKAEALANASGVQLRVLELLVPGLPAGLR